MHDVARDGLMSDPSARPSGPLSLDELPGMTLITDRSRPVIFLSDSHDSDAHRETVLQLSERLRKDGFDTRLDRYVNGSPEVGWPR